MIFFIVPLVYVAVTGLALFLTRNVRAREKARKLAIETAKKRVSATCSNGESVAGPWDNVEYYVQRWISEDCRQITIRRAET